ncbi:MAG: hypothetical protein J6S67_12665 [Methanobrevibacter sp.]|nr:hypothetical protein [Methanobrevibacter sp.]
MSTSAVLLGELAVSTATTTAVATSVNAEPLLTALIGLGVSIVTMVGGEIVKFLVAFFKNKREQLEGKDKAEEAEQENKEE